MIFTIQTTLSFILKRLLLKYYNKINTLENLLDYQQDKDSKKLPLFTQRFKKSRTDQNSVLLQKPVNNMFIGCDLVYFLNRFS